MQSWFPPEISLLARFDANGIDVVYLVQEKSGTVGLSILPSESAARLVEHRREYWGTPAWTLDSLVHLKCAGDAYPSLFCGGKTMRNSESTTTLRFAGQKVEQDGGRTSVITALESAKGYRCEHRLSWQAGEQLLECATSFTNTGSAPVTLQMLSSFSLGGMTPYAADDATGRLVLHRFRSAWCAEGRLESRPIEELQLEGFHYPNVPCGERFGQVGSMPVRGWFPFVALEDTGVGVIWAAQLAWPGSWQMEAYRRDDMLSLSGGLADREFGHWFRKVAPGETFQAPVALLSTAQGPLESVCDRLLQWQERAPTLPIEQDLPVVFNEWCTHWGKPALDKVIALADRLRGSGATYMVIDAGWHLEHGTWEPDLEVFPGGMEAAAAALRERGFVPGLWFEIETCDASRSAFVSRESMLLQRDGIPLRTQTRVFWDFRDPRVLDYLSERMIDLLERCGFGYLKIDYNDTIGLGCDGAESLGEGLRQHLLGVQKFWRRIRARLPNLVIENCSSGGHRIEPSMMALADQASFSDAHEVTCIPIVAANLHRTILPRKSQIWAVLRKKDDEKRIIYSMAATCLGRMALSGDIGELSEAQWELVLRAIRIYEKAVGVIRQGKTKRFGPAILSYKNPVGWQAVVRANDSSVLIVCHGFGGEVPETITLPLPEGAWRIVDTLKTSPGEVKIGKGELTCPMNGDWSACTLVLGKY